MATQPDQPPTKASYYQSNNPVSQTPLEQWSHPQRQRGDPVSHRPARPAPSDDEFLTRRQEQHQREQSRKHGGPDVDLEYGVEQQPDEGAIAHAVEKKDTRARTQEGAHSGPVGSAHGPGYSGFGEERDQAADLGRKREEHDRVLEGRPEPDGGETLRQQKLELDEHLDVKGAVREVTGDPVVGR